MRTLEEITRDLAAAQDAMLAADENDFAARDVIRVRQAELRLEAKRFGKLLGDPRKTEEIRRELRIRRDQYDQLSKQRIDLIKQSGAGQGTAPDAIPEATLNRALMAANGGPELVQRIAHLTQLLEERGETP